MRLEALGTSKKSSPAQPAQPVKRILRVIGLNVGGDIIQDVPIVGDVVGAASLKDDLDLLQAVAADVAESDAAIDFVKDGPYELSQLAK